MERKILIACVFFLSISISPTYLYALEHSTTPSGRIQLPGSPDSVQLLQGKRQEIQEALKAKREEFRERLQTIRNEVKRNVIESIDTRMSSVNKRVNARFSVVLNKLQSLLDRLVGRTKDAKLASKDTTEVELAIEEAQNGIGIAKAAVASQAANLYVIEIASESALRNDVGKTVSQLAADLRNVHKLVVDARQAVQKVIMELATQNSGPVIDRFPIATESPIAE